MVGDVQGWLDDPGSNFGWLLKGDESVDQTAKRFVSKDSSNTPAHPRLAVTYTTGIEKPVFDVAPSGSPDGFVDSRDLVAWRETLRAAGPPDRAALFDFSSFWYQSVR